MKEIFIPVFSERYSITFSFEKFDNYNFKSIDRQWPAPYIQLKPCLYNNFFFGYYQSLGVEMGFVIGFFSVYSSLKGKFKDVKGLRYLTLEGKGTRRKGFDNLLNSFLLILIIHISKKFGVERY